MSSIKHIKPAVAVLALFGTAFLPATHTIYQSQDILASKEENISPPLDIQARSAFALDLPSGEVLFEKNIFEPLPLASLSKIISSLVATEHIPFNEYVEIKKSAIETPEPSTLRTGEHLRAEDLIAMAMGESSNDAMMALVEHMGDTEWFLELMQEKARGFGAEKMIFQNPTGLDITDSPVASNYGSAYDLAQLIKNSLDSPIWQLEEKTEILSREGVLHKIKHTNVLRSELALIYGAKTGFTDVAGGNLILIVDRPLGRLKLLVILGSTLDGRFEDAKKILDLIK